MALEVHVFDVTVPAGTLKTAPQVSSLAMPPREITDVEVIVPSGTHGLVGFALGAAGRPFIPYRAGVFIVADDEKIAWPLEGQITSGAWQAFTYNTGQYPHTLQFRFLARLSPDAAAGGPAIIPSNLLSSP